MLRWLCSLLRVQLGLYGALFFMGHKFPLIFYTHSDTSCWTFICLQCCAFGDYFWWHNNNSNEKLKEKFGSCTRKTLNNSLQKTAILGTSHIIRKVLQCEAWSLSGGDHHRWFKRSTRKERPVTRNDDNNNNNNEGGRGCGLCVHQIWTSAIEIYWWGRPSNRQDCGLFICHRWTHASFVCRACWRIKCIQRILTLKMWKKAFRM